MSGAYDASSEIFSLYSHPPMTRASTCSQGTHPLVTPMDEGVHRAVDGPGHSSEKSAHLTNAVRVASTTPNEQYLSRESALQIIGEHNDAEPYGPYFSLQRNSPASTPSSGLSRRGTTKELIGRFESMSPTKSPSKYRQETPSMRPGSYPAIEKTNKRSPIRQSIRNFLSVFKKSANKTSGERSELSSVTEDTDTEVISGRTSSSATSVYASRNPSMLSVPQISEARQSLSICTTPISPTAARHSGPVLHLCRPSTSSAGIHPIWTHCTAAVHSTHLLLTSETPGGNPSTSIVAFQKCADVRSLSSTELGPNERAMLPSPNVEGGEGQVWKIFELLFEGRPREKFAVRSVGERAAWVSKIWDAILEAQEERSEAASIIMRRTQSIAATEDTTRDADRFVLHTTANGRSSVISNRSVASKMESTLTVDRALPDIPQRADKPPVPKLSIDIPPSGLRSAGSSPASKLSPLPRPPTTPTKTPTRTQSPSIMNLDKRSMVKQRLAQLESTSGSSSPIRGSPLSSASPTASRARSLRGGPDSAGLRRQDTSASGAVDSLVDSYRDTPINSPLSASSGRLTTVGPSSPARTPTASAFLKPLPQPQDIFSPASNYSTDDEVVIQPSSRPEPPAEAATHAARRPMIRLDTDAGPVKTPVAMREEQRALPHVPVHLRKEPRSFPVSPPFRVSLRDEPRRLPPIPQADSQPTCTPDGTGDVARCPEKSRDSSLVPANQGTLDEIQDKVNAILDRLAQRGPASPTPTIDLSSVVGRLDELRMEMQSGAHGSARSPTGLPDSDKLSELHTKLDALATLCRNLHDREPGPSQSAGDSEQVADILALLQGAQEQWSAHSEQQTDSIRYLNELNTWLEAFVNHGTSQIENVAAGVQMLCKELGPVPELQGPAGDGQEQPPQGSLLADVRKLLVETRGKDESSAALHAAVNGLIASVQEDLKKNAEARNMLTTESVVGLIDRQRQDQERMLRSLGTELSNEIRGERLRFVEAMKEATQINVQMHVEHFKKELTREVMLMTQDVSRLQRERQGLEQQIADLFAFYSKQKQAGAQLLQPTTAQRPRGEHQRRPRSAGPPMPAAQPIPVPGASGPPAPGTARRPLPTPSPRSARPASSFA
ncbi:hypothetical protein DAEQUDRAFT_811327 [Daedalea quercina L-15889]|uniref:Uncharacterized protein n=1 Tax=Daedalea quercina L-15889 TaxID=1314783 RepID=A0A165QJJ8_9APHY|nr:hypothetical protein DAEQUDRAFT_811327 [Daedalea quercina L-15889]